MEQEVHYGALLPKFLVASSKGAKRQWQLKRGSDPLHSEEKEQRVYEYRNDDYQREPICGFL